MPKRGGVTGPPSSYVVKGDWPDGELQTGAPEAAQYAQHIAVVLARGLVARNVSQVAEDAGLARSTIYDIVEGRTWPDLITLAKLETVLDVSLWPTAPT